ncbi:MAG: prepilin-type N-terminal cleavage/methylation domain-containing protein [Planctomycetota bacterium]
MKRTHLIGSSTASKARSGFTLTEVLVAITIIGILVGITVPVVINALGSAREAVIITEIKQMELAVEDFHSDHGFYPPTFLASTGVSHVNGYGNPQTPDGLPIGIQGPGDLLVYLNRISPQHNERASTGITTGPTDLGDGTRSRLFHWWVEVGSRLDQQSSLVFWLSGLCQNKQFPLTGAFPDLTLEGARFFAGTPPLAAHNFQPPVVNGAGREFKIERQVYFDFKSAQMSFFNQAGAVSAAGNADSWLAIYNQPHGKGDTLGYIYRDYTSYDIGATAATTWSDAYRVGPIDGSESPIPSGGIPYDFANPKGFQIVGPGMDGDYGPSGNVYGVETRGSLGSCGPGETPRTNDTGGEACFIANEGLDNMVSFGEGRLDKWIINLGN